MMRERVVLLLVVSAFLLVCNVVQAQGGSFSLLPEDDVAVCNDDQFGPDQAERGSGMHVRDIGVRRRVAIVVYSTEEMGGPGSVVSNVSFSNYGHSGTGQIVDVYGIIEEQDDGIDEDTITWNTAPGVINDPTPPLGTSVQESLDFNDLTPLLMSFEAPPAGERVSTDPNGAVANFINSDTDGIVAFLFAPSEENVNVIVRTKEMGGGAGGTYLEGDYVPSVLAHNPYPPNGAVEVPQQAVMAWNAGLLASAHNVYFGIDANAVAAATLDDPMDVLVSAGQSETRYVPPELLTFTQTYYWRVDEVNDLEESSPWAGLVWSFTVADFVVLDDFETYNDEDNLIFDTWVDGWVNGTGSTVGNLNEPFAEQTTVHSGDQSMPFTYDNFISPNYSEAERTWATAQDWTANDPNAMELWLNGDDGNSAEPLYVGVGDAAGTLQIVTNGNPAIVQEGGWVAWDVPLSVFSDAGVDLTAVTQMIVGTGNRAAPQSGLGGTVYFDDFRLMIPAPDAQ